MARRPSDAALNASTKLHQDAMELVDGALAARRAGDHDRAREGFACALDLERRAAEGEPTQPSRSILFRSAAWLAIEAEDATEAQRLAACGLADLGVPERIREELRAVAEQAKQPSDTILQELGAACFHPAGNPRYLGEADVEINLAGVRLGARTIPAGAIFRYARRDQLYRYALIACGTSPRDAVFFEALLSVKPLPKRPKRVRRSG